MPNNTFSWLHLTDFHYGLKGQDCLWPTLREPFLESLASLHERCGPWDAVFFTGDLVQSGESAQFKEMQTELLEPLWRRLGELGSGTAVLLSVPGNHDLFRPNPHEDNAAIDTLLDKDGFKGRVETKFWDYPTGGYRRVIKDAFAAYEKWWEEAPHRPGKVKAGILPGDFSTTVQCGGRRIGIVGLNTTFLQLASGDYKGQLVWDARQLHAVCHGGVDVWSKQHDICFLLTHQGPDWLTSDARKHGESEIAPTGRFAVHLFGHQHETEITYMRRGGSPNAVRLCQGCSVFGMDKFGDPPTTQRAHGYAAGRIEFSDKGASLRIWPRIATNKTGPWRFIPDHERSVLDNDEGTTPDIVATWSQAARVPPSPVISDAGSIAWTATFMPGGLTPHSTLQTRRPFFGRTKELKTIANYLLPEDRSWGVVLDGPGGIGKTALALEAAHRAPAEHYPLKLWVTAKTRELLPHGKYPLVDHHVSDYHAMLSEIGQALGRDDISKALPEERPSLIRHALANHRALLVLDNLETFSGEERRRVFELLGNLPAPCRAIVTSRRRTDGSTAAHNLRLDKLERDAADELLAELGIRWEPVARLSQLQRDLLYAETGGNPLLLTWTAGQLGRTTGRCRTVPEAVERLQEAHRREKMDAENDPLDFVFGDLVETFTADETTVLASLVHFTEPAPIEWLLPMTELSYKAVETALDGLRDRALLLEDDKSGTWLLPPLAARFLRRARPEAVGSSGERLAGKAAAVAVENGFENFSRFDILRSAWPQIFAALPLLAAGSNNRLQSVCYALESFLEFSGRWDDWLSLSTMAEVKALHVKDFRNAGWLAFGSGWCHYLRGRSTEVLECADRAVEHWRAARAGARERGAAILLRGRGHLSAKDYSAAISAYREALELHRSLSPRSRDVLVSLNALALALCHSGQIDEAESYYNEALSISKSTLDTEGIATVTGNLAALEMQRERWPRVESLALEAFVLAEQIGREELIGANGVRLAKALARQRRGVEGFHYATRALGAYTKLRSKKLAEAEAALSECLADLENQGTLGV